MAVLMAVNEGDYKLRWPAALGRLATSAFSIQHSASSRISAEPLVRRQYSSENADYWMLTIERALLNKTHLGSTFWAIVPDPLAA